MPMQEEERVLEINLISAQGLQPPSSPLRKLQTYALTWIDPSTKLRTRLDSLGGQNPTWNDKFLFRVTPEFLSGDTSAVSVAIYAVGTFRDHLIGTVTFFIGNVLSGGAGVPCFSAFQIRRPSGRFHGVMNIGAMVADVSDFPALHKISAIGYRDLMGMKMKEQRKKKKNKKAPEEELSSDSCENSCADSVEEADSSSSSSSLSPSATGAGAVLKEWNGVRELAGNKGLAASGFLCCFMVAPRTVPEHHSFCTKPRRLLRKDGNSMREIASEDLSQGGATEENVMDWVKHDNRRMLHVVYRVGDLERTIKFYTECLGMSVLRIRDLPELRCANAFLGYGPEDESFVIELTYNYGIDEYDIGNGFGHFGVSFGDISSIVDIVRDNKDGKIIREPGPVEGGCSIIAFIEDPDGYKFELLERVLSHEPLCRVMLRVGDLNRSIGFYEKACGMQLLYTRDNPECQYTIAIMGYGPEDENAVLELTYNYGVTEYDKGDGYAQIAIGTDDVYRTAEAIKLAGGKITREPGPVPGIGTKITACLDPDGWKTVFVDNVDFLRELE
ncbi:probable lactoylglutathione lyase, chloroplastic [Arachis hypogaea]|uniref:Lactoylglutathione lyase n=1 Tax=Arachis hypogaea TaxID=3818 RepID=A0A445D2N7_ARAHY|nr:lactoylglutathione lyase GLX1 [Arachis hypogaea]QHO42952.1 putative lactoylglutathione lyase [Arachis hypogaea]RYR57487.1 hypothetical protein Ahy_A05g023220 [Arachis hypogaea]